MARQKPLKFPYLCSSQRQRSNYKMSRKRSKTNRLCQSIQDKIYHQFKIKMKGSLTTSSRTNKKYFFADQFLPNICQSKHALIEWYSMMFFGLEYDVVINDYIIFVNYGLIYQNYFPNVIRLNSIDLIWKNIEKYSSRHILEELLIPIFDQRFLESNISIENRKMLSDEFWERYLFL